MRNALGDLHSQALRDLEGSLGVSPRPATNAAVGFQWLGVNYPAVMTTLAVGSTIEFGGRLFDVKFSLIVRKSVVAQSAQPFTAGKTLIYNGTEYRIVNVRSPAAGASWHLDLIDPNR